MSVSDIVTFEKLVVAMQKELQRSVKLSYIRDESIVITSVAESVTAPDFTDYLIRLYAPESGFLTRIPRIGQHFRVIYSVTVELWGKSSGRLAERLLQGDVVKSKGIYEVLQDVTGILEHNTFDILDNYPGSSIGQATPLLSPDSLKEGVGFLWSGIQYSSR